MYKSYLGIHQKLPYVQMKQFELCVDYENATMSKMFTLASGIGNYQRLFGSGLNLNSLVNGYKPVSEYDIISSIRMGKDELLY